MINTEMFSRELDVELKKITDDFNSRLQQNTEKLIKDITDMIDNIEREFDKLG